MTFDFLKTNEVFSKATTKHGSNALQTKQFSKKAFKTSIQSFYTLKKPNADINIFLQAVKSSRSILFFASFKKLKKYEFNFFFASSKNMEIQFFAS